MNILDVIAKAKAEKAKKLDLSDLHLRLLPQELFALEDLEELVLDQNLLVELPESIGRLKNLKSLSVSENDLMEIPESIAELSLLENLYPATTAFPKFLNLSGCLKI